MFPEQSFNMSKLLKMCIINGFQKEVTFVWYFRVEVTDRQWRHIEHSTAKTTARGTTPLEKKQL